MNKKAHEDVNQAVRIMLPILIIVMGIVLIGEGHWKIFIIVLLVLIMVAIITDRIMENWLRKLEKKPKSQTKKSLN